MADSEPKTLPFEHLAFSNAIAIDLVETGLEKRVISMSLDQLSKVSRAVGVAGGSRKYAAILGALRGHRINVLVTDHFTANRLANE
ncbi:MAG: sugar-binding domain-containing protein [Chloroflexota bacterium]